jgi:hypothetical protein
MAVSKHTTGQVVRLADFRAGKSDAAVAARAAMDNATNDTAYDAAAMRMRQARPTTSEGARVKLQFVREALVDLQEGEDFSDERWAEVFAAIDGADAWLSGVMAARRA